MNSTLTYEYVCVSWEITSFQHKYWAIERVHVQQADILNQQTQWSLDKQYSHDTVQLKLVPSSTFSCYISN